MSVHNTPIPSKIQNTQTSDEIQPDIFEAIRYLCESHYLLKLKNEPLRNINPSLIPKSVIEVVRDNGLKAGIPLSFSLCNEFHQSGKYKIKSIGDEFKQNFKRYLPVFYRGECRYHNETLPSGMRDISNQTGIPMQIQVLIDELKFEDFKEIVDTFPNTYFAQLEGYNIRYDALAQHYGLRTNLIDVTCEPFIAAFFATHRYDAENNTYQMVTDGFGCIKVAQPYFLLFSNQTNYGIKSIIGLQQFERPTIQRAFCWEFQQHADRLNWEIIKFRQSKAMSQKIHNLFYDGDTCVLFPEELIAKAANAVISRESVTLRAAHVVANKLHIEVSDIVTQLNSVRYHVVSSPAFRLLPNDFNKILRKIEVIGLFENRKIFEIPILLGDEKGLIKPDDSYSTLDGARLSAILSLFIYAKNIV